MEPARERPFPSAGGRLARSGPEGDKPQSSLTSQSADFVQLHGSVLPARVPPTALVPVVLPCGLWTRTWRLEVRPLPRGQGAALSPMYGAGARASRYRRLCPTSSASPPRLSRSPTLAFLPSECHLSAGPLFKPWEESCLQVFSIGRSWMAVRREGVCTHTTKSSA